MPKPLETEPKPEDSFVRKLLSVATGALDSAEFVAKDPRDIALAFQVLTDFDSLEDVTLVSETWFKRDIREKDKAELLHGEHPGAHISTSLSDGRKLEINIKGGIRDPRSQFELRDQVKAKTLQADRTIGLGDKTTEFNLHIYAKDGRITSEIWIKDSPGSRPSVALTALNHLNPETEEIQRLQNTIAFRKDSPDQPKYYERFHTSLRSIVKALVDHLG